MKIADKLARLRKTWPRLDPTTLAMHRTARDLTRKHQAIAAYFILESEEQTYTLHSTVFTKPEGRTMAAWRKWLDKHLSAILTRSILAGLALRSGKHWRFVKFIGFSPANVVLKS